jgi:hypothetical protein
VNSHTWRDPISPNRRIIEKKYRCRKVKANNYQMHYEVDDFTDPWKPAETLWIQHGFGRSSRFWYHWVPPLAGS